MGGTFFVTRLLGPARAFEWMTSGRRLSAPEALEWGLVSEVVPDDRLAERAAEWAGELAAMPTRGVGLSKRLFDNAPTATLEEQLELEAQLQAAATRTEDFREGVDAFLQNVSRSSRADRGHRMEAEPRARPKSRGRIRSDSSSTTTWSATA